MSFFVYRWEDVGKKKYYIGAHKGSYDDGYICSSKLMLEEYRNRPSDFTRSILSNHDTWENTLKEESRLLSELDAANDPLSYNQTNNEYSYNFKGHTEETKRKMSKSHTGHPGWSKGMTFPEGHIYKRPKSADWRKKISESLKGHPGTKGPSVKISTPFGVFDSMKEASQKLGIPIPTVSYRVNRNESFPEWKRIV